MVKMYCPDDDDTISVLIFPYDVGIVELNLSCFISLYPRSGWSVETDATELTVPTVVL
jgi:hypothetical protein